MNPSIAMVHGPGMTTRDSCTHVAARALSTAGDGAAGWLSQRVVHLDS